DVILQIFSRVPALKSLMRRGGFRTLALARRAGDPQKRDKQNEKDRGSIEEIESRKRERLLVHQALQEGVALLRLHAEAAEKLERAACCRIAGRQALDDAGVMQRGAALPERGGDRCGEGSGGNAQEVI